MGTFQRHLRGYSLQPFRQRFDVLKPVLVFHALDQFDDEAVALVLLVHWDIGMLALFGDFWSQKGPFGPPVYMIEEWQ